MAAMTKKVVVRAVEGTILVVSVLGETIECTERVPYQFLASWTVTRGEPLNFMINKMGAVIENCGKFSRLDKCSGIIVAELVNRAGVVKGYKVLMKDGTLSNFTKEDILRVAHEASTPLFQNAIIRNNSVCCYEGHPFDRIVIQGKNSTKSKGKAEAKPIRHEQKKNIPASYNQNQTYEMELCKKNGINPKLIANPNLSSSQMRVLWVSKQKGALSEYFCSPKYSVDAMKFYADRIVSKDVANSCAEMLSHPELTPEQLNELYQCVCRGIPYSDLCDKDANEIYVERLARDSELWGDVTDAKLIDTDILDKAVKSAMRLKGYTI